MWACLSLIALTLLFIICTDMIFCSFVVEGCAAVKWSLAVGVENSQDKRLLQYAIIIATNIIISSLH